MSLKEHFNSSKTAQSASLSDLAQEVESDRYVEAYRKLRAEYVPNVDFATASNFSHYGSAEKYYEDSVKRIYQNYPYDGSKYEMLCWEISGSHLDKWIYDNRYPKTTGHITMGITGKATGTQENGYGVPDKKEYLYLMGGPHAPESGEDTSTLKKVFDLGNVYDVDTARENNLEFKLSRGITTEFWLNKEAFDSTSTEHEVIFDLWNQRTSGSLDYGRLRIELAATGSESFRITARSGSSGFTDVSFGSDAPSPATVASSTWKHYAISLINSDSDVAAKLYVNGALTATKTITGAFLGPVTGALDATIGSLRTTPSGDLYHSDIGLGSGKLSASLDDFRYWKTERSPKQIGRNWFTNVYGGTNSDDANTMLGVYYKFNEGIYGSASYDATILDYSGRLSNASWINYTSSLGMRSTTSAMVLSNAAERERKDPIIYRTHPEVADLYSGLKVSGSHWDMQNNSSIMNSLPAWTTEYNNQPNKTLQEMTQIVGSYLDKLHQQISSLGSIKEPYGQAYTHNIHSSSTVPVPFSDRLVSGLGFAAPELFSEAKMVQALASRDEGYEYEEDIYKIKNQIYQNIYSSIFNIYKSKGTEKAFRNLIRCFGVDDELIKINLYANNSTYTIRDNYRYSSVKQKFISFNHPDRFASTLYQYADPETPNSRSFISGSGEIEEHIPFTLEAEVIFPSKPDKSEEGWYDTYFVTSSVFGMHEADSTTPSDNTIPSTDYCGMVVTAVRPDKDSNDATFVLSSSVLSAPISSSALPIEDVYENTKWNFAVRMRPAKWPFPDYISGSVLKDTHPIGTPPHTPNEDYILDFYGVQMVQDFKQDSFHVSASVSHEDGKNFMVSSKRVFAGAQRADISSAALTHNCDAKISNVAAWYNYIGNKEIDAHARDISNMGVKNPLEPIYIFDKDLGTVAIPQAETLLLHWDFSQVTSSGLESSPGSVDAKYTVADISSGSVANVSRYNSIFGAITEVHHTARGDYNLPSSTKVVSVEYIPTAVQELPEVQNSSDMIKLLSRDDEIFTSDTRPTDYFFAFEKSMYATISEEMVKMFATITDFNNLWGQPVNRYRLEYKDLSKLRQMFFERVSNTPDIDKYIEYYKWFDQAIGKMLLEMIPASVQSTESLVNTVESHVLERNKYWTKYPSMEMKGTDPESGLEGIHRLTE
ncbi:MAG TPA: hypothetical protein EYN67_08555, partial [Flavobacteriales bacterium]|nr:hypothetical protein [Flavobacteriales bacterium]